MPDFQHINVKIFARPGSTINWPSLIPVFHRWIREQATPELLIDVADYAHVPGGPRRHGDRPRGALQRGQSRESPWLRFTTGGAGLDGSTRERISQAYDAALWAARKLEKEPEIGGSLQFDEHDVEIWVNDRLAGSQ